MTIMDAGEADGIKDRMREVIREQVIEVSRGRLDEALRSAWYGWAQSGAAGNGMGAYGGSRTWSPYATQSPPWAS